MPRNLTTNWKNESVSGTSRPIIFWEGEFGASTIRLWSGYGDLTWDSKTWYGNGWLQGIGNMSESSEVQADGLQIVLTGIPQAILSLILGEARQGKSGKVWLGFIDVSNVVIADPYLVFQGKMDVPEVVEAAEEAVVTISYEGRLIDLERSKEFHYTHESQKIFYSDDKGFEYVLPIQDWNGFWGTTKAAPEKKKKKKK